MSRSTQPWADYYSTIRVVSYPILTLPFCSDSEISVESTDDLQNQETILDRIYALRDIIPPTTRSKISSSASTLNSYAKGTWSFTSKSIWVVSTTMILWGVPFGMALLQETELMEQEREQGMLKEGGSMVGQHLM